MRVGYVVYSFEHRRTQVKFRISGTSTDVAKEVASFSRLTRYKNPKLLSESFQELEKPPREFMNIRVEKA